MAVDIGQKIDSKHFNESSGIPHPMRSLLSHLKDCNHKMWNFMHKKNIKPIPMAFAAGILVAGVFDDMKAAYDILEIMREKRMEVPLEQHFEVFSVIWTFRRKELIKNLLQDPKEFGAPHMGAKPDIAFPLFVQGERLNKDRDAGLFWVDKIRDHGLRLDKALCEKIIFFLAHAEKAVDLSTAKSALKLAQHIYKNGSEVSLSESTYSNVLRVFSMVGDPFETLSALNELYHIKMKKTSEALEFQHFTTEAYRRMLNGEVDLHTIRYPGGAKITDPVIALSHAMALIERFHKRYSESGGSGVADGGLVIITGRGKHASTHIGITRSLVQAALMYLRLPFTSTHEGGVLRISKPAFVRWCEYAVFKDGKLDPVHSRGLDMNEHTKTKQYPNPNLNPNSQPLPNQGQDSASWSYGHGLPIQIPRALAPTTAKHARSTGRLAGSGPFPNLFTNPLHTQGVETSIASGDHERAGVVDTYGPREMYLIRHQIEYYLSDQNLVKDNFTLSLMDDQGWIPISRFLEFPRMRRLVKSKNVSSIAMILETSRFLQIDNQRQKIRRRKPFEATSIDTTWRSGDIGRRFTGKGDRHLANGANASNWVGPGSRGGGGVGGKRVDVSIVVNTSGGSSSCNRFKKSGEPSVSSARTCALKRQRIR